MCGRVCSREQRDDTLLRPADDGRVAGYDQRSLEQSLVGDEDIDYLSTVSTSASLSSSFLNCASRRTRSVGGSSSLPMISRSVASSSGWFDVVDDVGVDAEFLCNAHALIDEFQFELW